MLINAAFESVPVSGLRGERPRCLRSASCLSACWAIALGAALLCSADRYLSGACLGSEQGLSHRQHHGAGTVAAPHEQGGGMEGEAEPGSEPEGLGPGKWLFPKRQLFSLCILRNLWPKAMYLPCCATWCPGCFGRLSLLPPGAAPAVRGCCTPHAERKAQARWVSPELSLCFKQGVP